MVIKVIFEHYVMIAKKRYEPLESEWFVENDQLIIRSNFSNLPFPAPFVESVVQTPWGRYALEHWFEEFKPGDTLWLRHFFSDSKAKA